MRSASTSIDTASSSMIDAAVLAEAERHRDVQPLLRHLLRLPRDRQVHLDAALQHRRRHHEDDEQHQHHVDQRDHVDLGQAGRDAPAAAAAPADFGSADLRHGTLRHGLREVPFGDVQELEREVVHLRRVDLHLRREVVVEVDRGNGREQADRRRDERFGNAGRDDGEIGRALRADVEERRP